MTYSPETNRWEFLNFNDLQLFKDSLENSAQFEVLNSSYQADSSTFILGATGLKKEDLKLLVDRNYLALIGKRTPGCDGEAIEGFHRIPTLLSFQLTENRMIDFKKTTLRIQPNGIAELTVSFKSNL